MFRLSPVIFHLMDKHPVMWEVGQVPGVAPEPGPGHLVEVRDNVRLSLAPRPRPLPQHLLVLEPLEAHEVWHSVRVCNTNEWFLSWAFISLSSGPVSLFKINREGAERGRLIRDRHNLFYCWHFQNELPLNKHRRNAKRLFPLKFWIADLAAGCWEKKLTNNPDFGKRSAWHHGDTAGAGWGEKLAQRAALGVTTFESLDKQKKKDGGFKMLNDKEEFDSL